MSAAARIAELSETALRALAQGLRSGSLGPESSAARIASVAGIALQDATALLELMRHEAGAAGFALACETALESGRQSPADGLSKLVELVLSGPVVEGVEMRDTAAVFASLMREAREEVLVTSFVAGFARELLGPLADFLDAEPSRKATIVLNFQRGNDTTIERDLVARLADDFWTKQWPRGARRPTLCYDPRGLEMERAGRATMHAKVVVIDRRKAFVTSANLTERAQNKNIELGVLVDHASIAARIASYFEVLQVRGVLSVAP